MDEIVVVSGLPRSGTSMMMQMLAAGGMPVSADDHRPPDRHNPHGYFEDVRVRRIEEDAEFLGTLRGRAVKVVAPLVRSLPACHRYRVLFMLRDLESVLRSQARMLGEKPGASHAPSALRAALAAARDVSLAHCREVPFVALKVVAYEAALRTPRTVAAGIADFLKPCALDVDRMAAAVRSPA